jgi:cobalt-zinc-cadmium efflux system protein
MNSLHKHEHGHDHGDHHHHEHSEIVPPQAQHGSYKKLLVSFWIIAIFMVVEIVSGWLFHSLTLMSDGFHMLSDALALGLSAFAVSLSTRKATEAKTFGFKRFEILAAFGNGLTLVLLSVFIAFEAIKRLIVPVQVEAWSMLWIASLGLVVNIAVAWWLHHGGEAKTLNEESAFLHVLGDLGASLAAVAASLIILAKGWLWADPVLGLMIGVVIAIGGFRVMRRSGHILVEGTPDGIEIETVRKVMMEDKRIRRVHDLHLWTMNGRDLYLSAHIEADPGESSEKAITTSLTQTLRHRFKVNHITLQVGECVEDNCINHCESD